MFSIWLNSEIGGLDLELSILLCSVDSNVDPSLQRTQRRLKKAKLTDELNEKIANRPGPLELVEQHILEAEDPIKTAIQGKSS